MEGFLRLCMSFAVELDQHILADKLFDTKMLVSPRLFSSRKIRLSRIIRKAVGKSNQTRRAILLPEVFLILI